MNLGCLWCHMTHNSCVTVPTLKMKERVKNKQSKRDLEAHLPVRSRYLTLVVLAVSFVLFVFFNWRSILLKISGKSEKCLVYSPAYPSAGGAGCSAKCLEKDGKKTLTYSSGFYEYNHKWPQELFDNMNLAASIVKKFGQPKRFDTDEGRLLHVTFDYYCCYTKDEGVQIGQFLDSYSWTPHEIWFDKIECAIHSYDDAVSLVLMVDEKSQKSLTEWALQNERDLEVTTGIHKRIPHTQLQNFHMTLGTLNQSSFPVHTAVEEINRVIQPRKWHKSPVILQRPIFRCEKCPPGRNDWI